MNNPDYPDTFDENGGILRIAAEAARNLRRKVEGRLNAHWNTLARNHDYLESLQPSPFLTSFERYYWLKLGEGKLTLQDVIGKVDDAVVNKGVTSDEGDHLKSHIAFVFATNPPTEKEIEDAMEVELSKEAEAEEQRLRTAYRRMRRSMDVFASSPTQKAR